jgi:hypothetical protein
MYRLAVITKTGNTYSLNDSREAIDDYLLQLDEKEGIKAYRIIDRETKEVIEKYAKD